MDHSEEEPAPVLGGEAPGAASAASSDPELVCPEPTGNEVNVPPEQASDFSGSGRREGVEVQENCHEEGVFVWQ